MLQKKRHLVNWKSPDVFKPHLGQSIQRETRLNQWELEIKFYLAFLLNKRKFNAKVKDKSENTLDLCATKQCALKYCGIVLDKTELFDTIFSSIKIENQV